MNRLGQWEEYAFPELDIAAVDYSIPDFDFSNTPVFTDYGSIDAGSFDTIPPQVESPMPETYPPEAYTDEAGTTFYFDGNGDLSIVQDWSGGVSYIDPASGATVEQTDASGVPVAVTGEAPGPVVGGQQWSLKDIASLITAGAGLVKTVLGPSAPSVPVPAPRQGATRAGPTGSPEYYNAATRQWQSTPPAAPSAPIIPGLSNTVLFVGAGVAALAFMMARRR